MVRRNVTGRELLIRWAVLGPVLALVAWWSASSAPTAPKYVAYDCAALRAVVRPGPKLIAYNDIHGVPDLAKREGRRGNC